MPIRLEVLQANDGDCLLLRYGAGARAGTILIDGGSGGVYQAVLKKRLEKIRGSAQKLDIRLVVVSHIDADHITGIVDMFRDLTERKINGEEPRFRIQSLWHNSFEKLAGGRTAAVESSVIGASLSGNAPDGLDPEVKAVVASVKQGNDLRGYAAKLNIKINPETKGDLIKASAKGKRVIAFGDELTFTVIGPHQDELDALEESWQQAKKRGGTSESSVAADYLNRTVPNLSSIVVLAEAKGARRKMHRLLLTGDAGGDLILKGLASAGLSDAKGQIHVDLLKLQHHGSRHSVDIEFFHKVLADRYVICGNGKHGIPHRDTLEWLSAARSGEKYDVFLTNRKGVEGLTKMLDSFLAQEAIKEPGHTYHFREDPELSIVVDV